MFCPRLEPSESEWHSVRVFQIELEILLEGFFFTGRLESDRE